MVQVQIIGHAIVLETIIMRGWESYLHCMHLVHPDSETRNRQRFGVGLIGLALPKPNQLSLNRLGVPKPKPILRLQHCGLGGAYLDRNMQRLAGRNS